MYLTLSIWFSDSEPLTFEKLASQTTATNSTIYIGKVKCDDLTLRSLFTRFGKIEEFWNLRHNKTAFVKYDNKKSACSAIMEMNGVIIGQQKITCAWGTEQSKSSFFITYLFYFQ